MHTPLYERIKGVVIEHLWYARTAAGTGDTAASKVFSWNWHASGERQKVNMWLYDMVGSDRDSRKWKWDDILLRVELCLPQIRGWLESYPLILHIVTVFGDRVLKGVMNVTLLMRRED